MIWRTLAVAGVTTAMLAACGDKPAPVEQIQPVRVVRVNALMRSQALPLTATGMLRAREEVPLAFKIGGIVQAIHVEPGQAVKAGEPLAALDRTEIEAQLASARDGLERAERELERAAALFAKGMVAQRVEQDARTQRDQARAALAAVQFNHQHARIVAPAAGVILQKRAEPRETVAAGQAVLVLARLDRGWVVRAGLPARDAMALKPGALAAVTLDDAPQRAVEARVSRVAAASDPRTGTVEVELLLPDSRQPRVSGMVARLRFADKSSVPPAEVVLLPLPAVLEGHAGHAKVFVLDGGKVRRVDVATGRLLDGALEVTGLPADAQVVVEGAGWLSDGDAVRVLP